MLKQYIETLPNGVQHHIVEKSDDFKGDDLEANHGDNTDVYVVPEGQYFAMGDNRDHSSDSRVWGFVPADNLVGRASFIFYSTGSHDGALWRFWEALPQTRWGRLMSGIH